MRSRFTTLVALMALIPLVSLPAQIKQRIPLGTRVRITTSDTTPAAEGKRAGRPVFVVGRLIALNDSTLSVRNETGSGSVTVPLSYIRRVEVSTGSTRGQRAVMGGLIGFAAGAVLGYSAGSDCARESFCLIPRDEFAIAGAFVGGALGVGIGALLGHGERWRDASAARVTITPTGSHSLSIGATLPF